MAGKPTPGDGLPANLAGMTKGQLYDIMSQMKTLIEQNRQQAKEILIQNPLLTKALFQAQIMLGMVQPPQVIPNIQPAPQQPQQSGQQPQQSDVQVAHALTGQVGVQDQISASQSQPPMRKQNQSQPALHISSPSGPAVNLQSQTLSTHPLQTSQQPKGHMNSQVTSMSVTQSSQLGNLPQPSVHSVPQSQPIDQTQVSIVSSQLQQPLQTTGIPHLQLQPPLPPQPQPRPSSTLSFHHQYGKQMAPNMGYQHAGALHHPSQPMFHSSIKPQSSMGSSFAQAQPPPPIQQPPQSLYQPGGLHLGSEYNNQAGSSMQVDTGSAWISGLPDGSTITQFPGTPPINSGQMGLSNQPSRPATMSPDMEKALLQQVMSLTSEQINLLPPEQRNQVLQLQQMLRQ